MYFQVKKKKKLKLVFMPVRVSKVLYANIYMLRLELCVQLFYTLPLQPLQNKSGTICVYPLHRKCFTRAERKRRK